MKKPDFGKQIALTLICLLLGFAISLQFKSIRINKTTVTADNRRALELQTQLSDEIEKNISLLSELEDAKNQLADFRKNSEDTGAISTIVTEQLANAEKLAGLTALTGPGLVVTLSDASTVANNASIDSSVVHDSDLRTVINELLASGAEAISVNGERIVSTSSIRCVGPTIIINNTRLSIPFEITAIGDPKTLEAGLIVKGGIVDSFAPWGIAFNIVKYDKVEVPAYSGISTFKYAQLSEKSKKSSIKGGAQE